MRHRARPLTRFVVALLALGLLPILAARGGAPRRARPGPAGAGLRLNVNFQPAGAPPPAGYEADDGAAFGDRGNGFSYGWSGDNRGAAVNRNSPRSPDERYDTLLAMSGHRWEVAVPAGSYAVRLVGGDPARVNDLYRVEAEGVLLLRGRTTRQQRWREGSATVTVSDGRLTLRARRGARENRLCFIEILGGGNRPPAAPTITEPFPEGREVNPADVHMETAPFSDPDPGDSHRCSDWEIWADSPAERVWVTECIGGVERVHTHLGDGVFEGSHAGRHELLPETEYRLRVRHRDSSGDPATEWSPWAERRFHTTPTNPGGDERWAVRQPGYQVEEFATGFQLPLNIAFLPNPGPHPGDPFCYVTELYGTIKLVTRDGTLGDYATDLLNFNPTGNFPGSGEQGLTGLAVDPATGDVFASLLYDADGPHYPKVVRFHSTDGGFTAATRSTILDMRGETQGQSHQVSNVTIGPDGKLYVHMGDGFDSATAQDLNSFRGKILRLNLDGSAPPDNPFYDAANGITARDYVYAYGFRNPFGGAWRDADGFHYEVENGPSVDRFARVVSGRNYLWDGSDASMANFALFNWDPATAPVNLAFVQAATFGGSGFPVEKMGHAFVAESGPTWATGPQGNGKRISEFVLDANGNRLDGPRALVEYAGSGKATVAGLAAGPDGLYFTDLYKDSDFTSPIDRGANLLRVRLVGSADFSADVTTAAAPPLTVHFTDRSNLPAPASWFWEFGDGATSTDQNPTHTYQQAGLFGVRLTVTGAGGMRTADKPGFIGIGGVGLLGDYFDQPDFTGQHASRIDPGVDFDWGEGAPHPAIGVDTFSVRWTGQVQPRFSETYTFHTVSDDGVRLWVNDRLVIDNWTDHPPTEDRGTIALLANQRYALRMELYENGGGAVARLEWSSATQGREVIPASRLYPAAAGPSARRRRPGAR